MNSLRDSIRNFLNQAPALRILVIGDAMLDAYVSGEATRISPEAPVPVIAVTGKKFVMGGAANVAANVRAIGASAALAGVTGIDESGSAALRRLLAEAGYQWCCGLRGWRPRHDHKNSPDGSGSADRTFR